MRRRWLERLWCAVEDDGITYMKPSRPSNLGTRADEIHGAKPNLFYSVLVLHRYRSSVEQIEIVLNLLFIVYLAIKATGRAWPLITEATQERCLTRLTGRIRFVEGLTLEQQSEAAESAMHKHREPRVLALAFGQLQENDLLGIRTDAERYLVLATLNLVECITEATSRNAAGRPRAV